MRLSAGDVLPADASGATGPACAIALNPRSVRLLGPRRTAVALVRGMEQGRLRQMFSPWLAIGSAVHATVSVAFRLLSSRSRAACP